MVMHPMDPASRLRAGVEAVDLETLAGQWRSVTLPLTAPRPPMLDDGPSLAGRVRGALGRVLSDWAKAGDREAAMADHLLFGPLYPFRGRLPVPAPYVVRAGPAPGGGLCIQLTLFGFALRWAAVCADALVDGLRGGLTLFSGARVRARLVPDALEINRREALPVLPLDAGVALCFLSPLAVMTDGALTTNGVRLVMGLANRIGGLARWQDLSLNMDFRALRAAAEAVEWDAGALRPVHWVRYSSRQGRAAIPMTGLTGVLTARGPLAPLAPLLSLGAQCHAGGHAVHGMGAYDPLPLPSG
ncbi:MAG: hypothetical protein K9H11_14900 [Rhodospirillum sp.]|nr:hypothetical protein [Rhodospirillum sp.]